jgi:single-strand DNA-binding protein
MLNQIVLVGRLTNNPEIVNMDNGKAYTKICLAVKRTYKNINGEYDTDFIYCTLWQGIAENTCNYCKKGDVIGVKGHVQSNNYE